MKILWVAALLALLANVYAQTQQNTQVQGQPGQLAEDEEYYDDELLPEDQHAPQQSAAPQPIPAARPAPAAPSRVSSPSLPQRTPVQNFRGHQQTQLNNQQSQPAPEVPQSRPAGTRTSASATSARHSAGSNAAVGRDAPNPNNEFFECPEKFGFWAHARSCDKYWKCEDNIATLKLCGNGLVFEAGDSKRESCNYPFTVDCAERTELEPPKGTETCPRLFGIFADEQDCRVFWSCWGGEAKKYECSPGLAFDESNRVCTWADKVDRCQKKEVAEGFSCPDPSAAEQAGTYTRHPHPDDCRKFFVCIVGTPRMYGCELGNVYNIESTQCDDPENVPGCEDYYGELDIKGLKKAQLAGASQSLQGPKKQSALRGTQAAQQQQN